MTRISALYTFLLLLAASASLQAQQPSAKIILKLQNEQAQPLTAATIELLKADSSLLKIAVTDASGTALFEGLPAGNYLFRAAMIGYQTRLVQLPALADAATLQPAPVELVKQSKEMAGVTVSGRKPFIQKLSDRLVVNVDNSIVNAGSSAMEVLERSPGVNVDPNDVISLRGKAGVIIMIDGKPTAMSGQDLANYLRGLPTSAIERIDIITNPSARYDAAGNAGIIDIRMKKDQRYGINGTATAGYGQGVYPKANSGITFNYRNKRVNLYGNYNYAYRVGLNHLFLDRNFYTDNGAFIGQDKKDNFTKSFINTHSSRMGLDIFVSKRTIIGVVVNGNFNRFRRSNDNESVVIDEQKQPSSTFNTQAGNRDKGTNWVANFNLKHTFDSTGREITTDLDYGQYNSSSYSRTATQYYKLDGSSQQPDYILDGHQTGKLRFFTAKSDYTQSVGKAKLEAGFKLSFVSADNDARFFDMSSGTPENDVNKTNHFYYDENNNAAYINWKQGFGKLDLQLGLRGEQTNVRTRQAQGDVRWDSSYLQLFPSAFANWHFAEEKTLGFSVSRRIDRPGYSQLNPFLFLIDVTTYATGRPGLLPQLTWSYEWSYTVKSLNFTLAYSRTKNNQNIAIARFADVFPDIPTPGNVTVQIPINLRSSDYFGFGFSAPVRISKWWNMLNNGNIYYEKFNGSLGVTQLSKGRPAMNAQSNNTFMLGKGWAAELNGQINTGGQYGFMVMDPQWAISTGIQKSLWKNKATIRANITDIFWTNLPKAVITYDNYVERWHAQRETRVAAINFTYRFGSNKVQQARRRSTGSEEERQRAGN